MSSPTPAPRASGRFVIAAFVVLALATVAGGLVLRTLNARDREGAAKLVVKPLSFTLRRECVAPGAEPVVHEPGGACPAGGTLKLTLDAIDPEVGELAYAWVTPESDTLGALDRRVGLSTGLALGRAPGERFLVLIAASKPLGPNPLAQALEPLPKGAAPRHRAAALRGHAAILEGRGNHSRSEIFKVVVP